MYLNTIIILDSPNPPVNPCELLLGITRNTILDHYLTQPDSIS